MVLTKRQLNSHKLCNGWGWWQCWSTIAGVHSGIDSLGDAFATRFGICILSICGLGGTAMDAKQDTAGIRQPIVSRAAGKLLVLLIAPFIQHHSSEASGAAVFAGAVQILSD